MFARVSGGFRCLRLFKIVLSGYVCFKFVAVCVVAVLGCAWPSWLFHVASGVKREIRLFQVVSNCLSCFFVCFYIVYSCSMVV